MKDRSSGILCHISSLASSFGIGDIGLSAQRFVDFLRRCGQNYWQVLPLNPTDGALGNSPYSSYSAFAFNTLFISPELLYQDGLVTKEDLKNAELPLSDAVDFQVVTEKKYRLLLKAYETYSARPVKLREFEQFCRSQSYWLDQFAMFVVLKHGFRNACWVDWPVEYRDRHEGTLARFAKDYARDLEREKFLQFLFYKQWIALQTYCSQNGIKLIGDIPIYVNYDSVDVWVHPDLFKLNTDKRPVFVAGVPPDYFSKDGQRWGNPVYNWDRLRENGFRWWMDRVRHNFMLFDVVRVDHFRAFAECWEIPAHEKTAINGSWRPVPGVELFETMKKHFPKLPIIAEDLGIITDDVVALKDRFGFPGMRVLMFAFHNEYKKSRDLPENYTRNSVVFTGTHDNNTVLGWFKEDMTEVERRNMFEYLGKIPSLDEIGWVMIELALKSPANLAIIPIQDVLGFAQEARMNKPSTSQGNWKWRLSVPVADKRVAEKLRKLTVKYQR
nr:4-alpha-glucanotransferase (Glycoside hydrolase, family 77) [uncultured bacterium]